MQPRQKQRAQFHARQPLRPFSRMHANTPGFDFVNPDIQFLDAQAMEGGADVQVGMGMSGGASGGASKSRSGLGSPDTVAEVDGWFAGWDLMKVACAN
mmetsp:Transcript_109841/g.319589  ORF Transcript_109841/g.319589 Transcript_109841/m.319589 type:complete len:98 (-) Transcript_109841:375-668(-)